MNSGFKVTSIDSDTEILLINFKENQENAFKIKKY